MGRINPNDMENYQSGGNSEFFSLPNDKDIATVRFMYETFEEVDTFAVHEIEVNGKRRYINCLRDYTQPLDDCPLCLAKYPIIPKMFVSLYDVNEEKVKIWDRGRSFKDTILGLCNRYNPLVSTPFEIERQGKKGDTGTKYMPYPLQSDDTMLADLPERTDPLGTIILDKTYEDIEDFLQTGSFPAVGQPAAQEVATRRPAAAPQPAQPARRSVSAATTPEPAVRPLNRRSTNNDKF